MIDKFKSPILLCTLSVVVVIVASISYLTFLTDRLDVTAITFTERSNLEVSGNRNDKLKVTLTVRHDGEQIDSLYSRSEVGDEIVEERKWHASMPEKMSVRNWTNCRSGKIDTPMPKPENLTGVLEELFGSRESPPNARPRADGTSSWTVEDGAVKSRFIDHGGRYPDRTVELIDPGGVVISKIEDSQMVTVEKFPDWADGWGSCEKLLQ